MRVAAEYSFKGGKETIERRYPDLIKEILSAVACVNSEQHKTKASKEKTMPGRMLYNPVSLNEAFKKELIQLGWKSVRVECDYPTKFYAAGYTPRTVNRGAFREMDFLKRKLGLEVQFGKYAFMVY